MIVRKTKKLENSVIPFFIFKLVAIKKSSVIWFSVDDSYFDSKSKSFIFKIQIYTASEKPIVIEVEVSVNILLDLQSELYKNWLCMVNDLRSDIYYEILSWLNNVSDFTNFNAYEVIYELRKKHLERMG